jgi:hypothetical protein
MTSPGNPFLFIFADDAAASTQSQSFGASFSAIIPKV